MGRFQKGDKVQVQLTRSVWKLKATGEKLPSNSRVSNKEVEYAGTEHYWVDAVFEEYVPSSNGEKFERITASVPGRWYEACHPDCVRPHEDSVSVERENSGRVKS